MDVLRSLLRWGWRGSSKCPWAWTSARPYIGELGYAVLDGREVWEASVVEAAAVAATALGILQEARCTGEQRVVSQYSGTSWQQGMGLQKLQVSQNPRSQDQYCDFHSASDEAEIQRISPLPKVITAHKR